jgi:ABC-type Fe3+-hydroxamate transport system substrate-binding protein
MERMVGKMFKHKFFILFILILVFLTACKEFTSENSSSIDKQYKVYIYSSLFSGKKSRVLEEINVKLYGTLEKGEKFDGFFEYGDNKYKVQTDNRELLNLDRNLYYRIKIILDKEKLDKSEPGLIIVSKDFEFISGATDELYKKYENGSYFKSDKNLSSIFELK